MPTATIYADKDAYISSATASRQSQMASEYQNVDDPAGALKVKSAVTFTVNGHSEDAVIGFPGSIPQGAIISAATLYLHSKFGSAGGGVSGMVIPDFNESSVKWNDYQHYVNPAVSPPVNIHESQFSTTFPAPGTYASLNVLGRISSATRAAFLLFATAPYNRSGGNEWTEYDISPSESGNPPYLVVTYSAAPGAPGSISVPANNAVYDKTITLFAGNAVDPDTAQASLRYEWSYQYNNGAWVVIPGLTDPGTTQKVVDVSTWLPGLNAYKGRIRSWDGSQWGPYTTQSGTFSIFHTSRIKRWSGIAWIEHNLSRWSGSAWVGTKLKRWTGSAWIQE